MNTIVRNPLGVSHRIPYKLTYDYVHDPIKTLTNLTKKYGSISHFRLGRQKNVYFINNPDYIEQVLISGNDHFQKMKTLPPYQSLLGEGLVTSEGEFHDS